MHLLICILLIIILYLLIVINKQETFAPTLQQALSYGKALPARPKVCKRDVCTAAVNACAYLPVNSIRRSACVQQQTQSVCPCL